MELIGLVKSLILTVKDFIVFLVLITSFPCYPYEPIFNFMFDVINLS